MEASVKTFFSLTLVSAVFLLAACGGGGGSATSPTNSEGPVSELDTDEPVELSEIHLTHFSISSQSDTRPEDDTIEINTTWNQGLFTFEFSADAYDVTSKSERFDFALYLSPDEALDVDSDKLFRSGSCNTGDINFGYSCDAVEVQTCRLFPQSSYYVGSCRNRLAQVERSTIIADLFNQLPQSFYAILEVCHTNQDSGLSVRDCLKQSIPVMIY